MVTMVTGPTHLDILRVFTLGDADHPEELVDVITGVSDHSSKDDEYVVDSKTPHDVDGLLLSAGHSLSHQSYVAVVPGVVVHQRCAVSHPCTQQVNNLTLCERSFNTLWATSDQLNPL